MIGVPKDTFGLILSKSGKIIFYLSISFPAIFLLYFLHKYAVDVPFWDQWWFLKNITASIDGTLKLSVLLQQFNEHRAFFPYLLIIFLARISGWNIKLELYANFLIALLTFFLLGYFIRRITIETKIKGFVWLLPIISLFIFSLSQWFNWFMGMCICIFLALIFFLGGVMIVGLGKFSPVKIFLGLIMGTMASFSFASGLPYFLVVPFLFLPNIKKISHKIIYSIIWIIYTMILYIYYFHGFEFVSDSLTSKFIFSHPRIFISSVLEIMGAPLFQNDYRYAIYMGLINIFLIFFTGIYYLTHKQWRKYLLILFVVDLYVLGNDMVISFARSWHGANFVLNSEYVTLTNLSWISHCILLFICYFDIKKYSNNRLIRLSGMSAIRFALVAIYLISWITSIQNIPAVIDHNNLLLKGIENAKRKENSLLFYYADDPENLNKFAILEKYQLSLFRKQ